MNSAVNNTVTITGNFEFANYIIFALELQQQRLKIFDNFAFQRN